MTELPPIPRRRSIAADEYAESETPTRPPSSLKLFVIGFILMVVGGVLYGSMTIYGDDISLAFENTFRDARHSVGDTVDSIDEFTDQRWVKDRTLYYTVDENGFRWATDEEVEKQKEWEQGMKDARESGRSWMDPPRSANDF